MTKGKPSEPKKPAPATPRKRGRPRGRFTQFKRVDTLRQKLEQKPSGLTLYELADILHLTPRSMRRYLAEVGEALEIERVPGKPGGAVRWRIKGGEKPRNVGLRRTQAYAMVAARKVFEPLRGSALFDEIDEAAKRLVALAQRPGRGPNTGFAYERLEDRFLYLPVAPKDYGKRTEALDDLFQAVADLRPLRCMYASLSNDGREESIEIHPYAMVLYRDAVYCVGRHVAKGDVRTFLLDRMRATEISTLERFELPADFAVADYFQGEFGIWKSDKKQRVVIDFEPKVAQLVRSRRVHPTQKLKALDDGGVRLAMTVGDLRELTSWLLQFGRTVRVIEPPELVAAIRDELAEALAKYGGAS